MNLINIFDAPIHHFQTINSTNTFAKELCKQNPENGTLIISDKQTNGRGRLGNSWESTDDKGLYYSIIFKKQDINLKYQTLPLFISLAITELLDNYDISSTIKWPNDILIKDKKVCGILCESTSNNNGEFIIAGIGINMYHNFSDFSQNIKNKATSLKLNTSQHIIKNFFINNLTIHIHKYYNYFLNNDFSVFLNQYQEKSYIINKTISVNLNKEHITGIVSGFNTLGHLILNTDNKTIEISSGETTLKNNYKKSD